MHMNLYCILTNDYIKKYTIEDTQSHTHTCTHTHTDTHTGTHRHRHTDTHTASYITLLSAQASNTLATNGTT